MANRFLTEISRELKKPSRGISEGAAQLLLQYPWPGNVREWRSTIRRAAVLGAGFILPEHFCSRTPMELSPVTEPPQHELPGFSLRKARECASAEAERRVIRQVGGSGEQERGSPTAGRLISRRCILKMHRYGISAQDFNGSLAIAPGRSLQTPFAHRQGHGPEGGRASALWCFLQRAGIPPRG